MLRLKVAVENIGSKTMEYIESLGQITVILLQTIYWFFRPPYRFYNFARQLDFIGVKSIPIIALTGAFTGMVFALQSSYAFSQFQANYLVGPTVVLSLTREMGPVLGALMITARAGSAISAEIGTMRVTEQIDALHTMAVNPIHYLVVPRVAAAVLMSPLLCGLFDFIGTVGAYIIAVGLLDINHQVFIDETIFLVDIDDLYNGMIKATFFGLVLSIVGCYKGLYTKGGAEGVGRATTESVVLSSVSILISDYFLTALLF
jgi:phospholipid/cholesterol/gamma-HCH transport system permease protein